MASIKPSNLDQKKAKQTFQFLKKGSGLQNRKGILNNQNVQDYSKRKANFSPKKDELSKKPLIDMTNDSCNRKENMAVGSFGNGIHLKGNVNKKIDAENIMPKPMKLRPRTKQPLAAQSKPPPRPSKFGPNPRVKLPQQYSTKSVPQSASLKSLDSKAPGSAPSVINEQKTEWRASLDSTKSDENLLYVTALEDCTSDPVSSNSSTIKTSLHESTVSSSSESSVITVIAAASVAESFVSCKGEETISHLPPGVEDFDADNWNDPFQASCYAMDIFTYLKSREVLYPVDGSYIEKQKGLSTWMRALLVDWMVEIQETFELNHETLYLAVKIVDLFLTRHKSLILKENLQLVGTTALFIASKFDERIPPTLEDFKYLCDEAYTKSQLVNMESTILRVLDFNLGIPLSYRFLRRYARCSRVPIEVLTLARFILEMSLMDYSLISRSDSKMAAAALLLARKMKGLDGWTPTLEYYTGYTLDEIKDLTHELNAMIHKKPRDGLMTVRNKYSHRVFHEVAKVPLINDLQL